MDERYNHYVTFGIPLDLDKLNEKVEKEGDKKNIRRHKMESKLLLKYNKHVE